MPAHTARGVAALSSALALSACPFVMEDSYEVRDEPTTALPDVQQPDVQQADVQQPDVQQPACGTSAPTPGPCPPGCDCPDATSCIVHCEGPEQCKDRKNIHCPPGRNCRVICSGEKACEKAEVTCNGAGSCDVECSGVDACKEFRAKCSTGPCSLSCVSGCDKAKLECGNNSCHSSCGNTQKPQLVCGPSCGCAQC